MPSSKYKGVTWHKARGKWLVHARVDGKARHVGYFEDEEAAARAYDKAMKRTNASATLNFLPDGSLNPHRRRRVAECSSDSESSSSDSDEDEEDDDRDGAEAGGGGTTTPSFRGVLWDRTTWRAYIKFRGHQHQLGAFDTAEAAAQAFDAAAKRLWFNPVLNFLPDGSLNPDRKKNVGGGLEPRPGARVGGGYGASSGLRPKRGGAVCSSSSSDEEEEGDDGASDSSGSGSSLSSTMDSGAIGGAAVSAELQSAHKVLINSIRALHPSSSKQAQAAAPAASMPPPLPPARADFDFAPFPSPPAIEVDAAAALQSYATYRFVDWSKKSGESREMRTALRMLSMGEGRASVFLEGVLAGVDLSADDDDAIKAQLVRKFVKLMRLDSS